MDAVGSPREQRSVYRYMSRAEAEAVARTGMLRGGRPGRTYWTDERYESSREAKRSLALKQRPQVRMEFRITNEPKLILAGARVRATGDEPGGGIEYVTLDAVEVEVIRVDPTD